MPPAQKSNAPPTGDSSGLGLIPVEDAHVDLVHGWFEAEHVRPWWGDPATNREELAWHRAAEGVNGCRIITDRGEPVGYIQWTDLWVWVPDLPYDLPKGTVDLDILIGEPTAMGRGLGPAAVAAVVAQVTADCNPPLFSMFTSAANERAMRAYEKIGFVRREGLVHDEFGESWLMTFDPRA